MTGDASEPTLRSQVDQALDNAAQVLASPGPRGAREALADARLALEDNRARWCSRMRVALAGRTSSGKSTLINALLGEKLAATAGRELTSVVTWLRHSPQPELTVHYREPPDVEQVVPPTLEALADLTTHATGREGSFADNVDFVTFGYPNGQLTAFDLIDTPGTDSVLGADSASTVRHLGPRVDTADALVLVFARGMHVEDEWLLAHFQRSAKGEQAEVSPLTTIGALTQVELNWKHDQDLMAGDQLYVIKEGTQTAGDLMRNADLRRVLYDLRPIASKVAEAAGIFTQTDFADLTGLAGLAPRDLAERVARPRRWARGEVPGVLVPADRRGSLLDRFTACGLVLACQLIREGVTDPGELRRRLRDLSGLTGFRQLLVEHFGERADLIKLIRLIKRTRTLRATHRVTLTARQYDALDRATRPVIDLELTHGAFGESIVLRDYYDGKLQFGDSETAEMLRLFGELPGVTLIADRLGLPGASSRQLADLAEARSAYWRKQADLGTYHGATRNACHVISNSYNHLRAVLAERSLRPAGDIPGPA